MSFKILLDDHGHFFVGDYEGKPVVPSGKTLEELQDCLIGMLGALEFQDAFGAKPRSSSWPSTRRKQLELFPSCAGCGRHKDPRVHHVVPFHENPDLELDQKNLITLCPVCHFAVGHLFNFRSWNVDVVKDCEWLLSKVESRP